MKRFLSLVGVCLLLTNCQRISQKESASPFPIKLNLKSYTVVNYIPLRRGENLDHLLELEKWAQAKANASGLKGEAVLALIEGRASLENHPTDESIKRLFINIVFSFEFKNQPTYGQGKVYFRLAEEMDLKDSEIPQLKSRINQKLTSLDRRFLDMINTQFPGLKQTQLGIAA